MKYDISYAICQFIIIAKPRVLALRTAPQALKMGKLCNTLPLVRRWKVNFKQLQFPMAEPAQLSTGVVSSLTNKL